MNSREDMSPNVTLVLLVDIPVVCRLRHVTKKRSHILAALSFPLIPGAGSHPL